MATICAAPIKGTHLRIVKVDECGAPVTGVDSLVVVTKGFVQVVMDPQYEDGEEFFERNADGDSCVNQKDAPTLKRMQLTVDYCEVNPAAAGYVTSGRTIVDGSDNTGFALSEGTGDARFSMEVWQRVAGAGACDPEGAQRFIYNAWPNVGNVQIGQYTIENGRSTLQFVAETQAASEDWADGPTDPAYLPEPVEFGDHWIWNLTTTALPTEACEIGSLSS